MDTQPLGKILIAIGALFVLLGGFFYFVKDIPFIGRLPGDIQIERPGFKFYFPIVTCILICILLSALMWVISRFR